MESKPAASTFEYRPLAPETIADPYRAYANLRETPGLYWHEEMHSYVASRYAACKRILSDNAHFAKDRSRAGMDVTRTKVSVQTEDPPHRLGLRQEMRGELHSMDLKSICSSIGQAFEDRLQKAGTDFDFVSKIAYPAALDLTATVVGLSADQAEDYMTTHRALQRATDGGLDSSRLAEGRAAGTRLQKFAAEWVEGDGVEGLLAPSRHFAEKYPSAYAINTLAGMVNASFSTASSFTAGIFNLLVRDGELRSQVRSAIEAGRIGRVVNEFLRYLAPAQATSRVVVKPCDLEGTKLDRGDTVVALLASANRDPNVFPQPDVLVLNRFDSRHLSFAAGPHMCLGKRLAEDWGSELLRRISNSQWVEYFSVDEPEYLDSATVRAITSLRVIRAQRTSADEVRDQ